MGAGLTGIVRSFGRYEVATSPFGLLVAGGNITHVNGVPTSRVAIWDGTDWAPINLPHSTDSSASVRAIATFAYDSSNPHLRQVTIGGWLPVPPNSSTHRIFRLTGDPPQSWELLNTGASTQVFAMVVHDFDGTGPEPPQLIVAQQGAGLRRWHGSGWVSLATGMGADSLYSWIPEPGQTPQLIAGGPVWGSPSGTAQVMRIVADGTIALLGTVAGASSTVLSLGSFDADGNGPLPRYLLVGGDFQTVDGQPSPNLARWDGTTWSSMPGGSPDHQVRSIVEHYPPGAELPELWIGGRMGFVGEHPSFAVARWGVAGAPRIRRQPRPLSLEPGDQATFRVSAEANTPFSYTWRRNGVPLANGPAAGGSMISGADAAVIVISNIGIADAGHYDCVLENGCGVIHSDAATLFVDGNCYPNCDSSTVTPILNVDDFTCFINEFAAAQSLPHAQQISHYANCDGSTVSPVLNVDDFTCFINAFAAGCP